MKVWTCYGYCNKQQRHVALNYLREYKHEAYAICKQLHPTVDIFTVHETPEN